MIQSFRSYLQRRVLYLDELLIAMAVVQRKRRKRLPHPKEKQVVEQAVAPVASVIGVSKTASQKPCSLVGESKTSIPDFSAYVEPKQTAVPPEERHSISVALLSGESDEVDLSEEEIPLDAIQTTATGVTIEEIETMNRAERELESLSASEVEGVCHTTGILAGTVAAYQNDSAFSQRLHTLLEHCEESVQVTSNSEAQSTEKDIDELF